MAMIVLIGLGVIIANLGIQQDNLLYPVKVTVQGLQVTIANTGRRLGIGQPFSASPIALSPVALLQRK
jgi:hypothetical protein